MAKRLQLANNVWRSMKQTDSRECRNCHTFDSMTVERQRNDTRFWHPMAIDEGFTCIDCHKGIAYQMPDMDNLVSMAAKIFYSRMSGDNLNTNILFSAVNKALLDAPGRETARLAQLIPGSRLQVDERKSVG
jgi:hypothetical protein